ncbi:MAG: hypothetical protein M3R46_03995 [Actinomycetota bacterium]|nr:hypothetical protein [Actinomycetota bacterium]
MPASDYVLPVAHAPERESGDAGAGGDHERAETAEHAAVANLAPEGLRGSAFGLLAALQSAGNLAASAIAGALWTLISPTAAFLYAAAWMLLALTGLIISRAR